jgi:formylglycine-generating enzyme required for sulfatase activity
MRTTFACVLVVCGLVLVHPLASRATVVIDTVPIGNPGNANDSNTGNLYGGVPYSYGIGKFEVTVGQYTEFLNAVAATDTYGLYNPSMATNLNIAGIAQNGMSGSFTYSVIGSANHPISYVNWGDAARFANWLTNGQPTGAEGPGTTETGSYTLNGAVTRTALNAVTRNASAAWVIPTESEWYKAAYYDPGAGHYWNYPTGTVTKPTSAPPGSTPNTANYFDNVTGYAVTQSTSLSSSQNYLTDFGAYTASASPYGTFDQGGNVSEWTEALPLGRVFRGGSWDLGNGPLQAAGRATTGSETESSEIGFRLAAVPEPTSKTLAAIALLIWAVGSVGRSRFM